VGQVHLHRRTLGRRGVNRELPTVEHGSLAYTDQAKVPSGSEGVGHLGSIKALAVVSNGKHKAL
jgi:hypothetical protein